MVVDRRSRCRAEVDGRLQQWTYPIANGQLDVRVAAWAPSITTIERLLILLPVLMWVVAALISWLLVNRLLIRPLRRLQRVIGEFQPGDDPLVLPRKARPGDRNPGAWQCLRPRGRADRRIRTPDGRRA